MKIKNNYELEEAIKDISLSIFKRENSFSNEWLEISKEVINYLGYSNPNSLKSSLKNKNYYLSSSFNLINKKVFISIQKLEFIAVQALLLNQRERMIDLKIFSFEEFENQDDFGVDFQVLKERCTMETWEDLIQVLDLEKEYIDHLNFRIQASREWKNRR